MVNRVWLHLFGRGLVATPDNFGAAGQPPDHPELLDSLAVTFMDQGWSVKKLIRQIVLSRAYQLASTPRRQELRGRPRQHARLADEQEAARGRGHPRRDPLRQRPADLEPPVGSAVAQAGEGLAGPIRRFNQDGQDMHRAVYLPVVRDQVPDSLALFDFADPSLVTGERATTSGPSQALYLMNNPFVIRQAEAAADRLRACGRQRRRPGQAAYLRFLARNADRSRGEPGPRLPRAVSPTPKDRRRPRAAAAWTAFCQALYASAEFRYLD